MTALILKLITKIAIIFSQKLNYKKINFSRDKRSKWTTQNASLKDLEGSTFNYRTITVIPARVTKMKAAGYDSKF